jgi:hypothetical protein
MEIMNGCVFLKQSKVVFESSLNLSWSGTEECDVDWTQMLRVRTSAMLL